jgi:hypothetical protein
MKVVSKAERGEERHTSSSEGRKVRQKDVFRIREQMFPIINFTAWGS